ncbi:MAG: hypothetical protein RL885_29820 [Planctomycetota bacterium]
MSSNRCTRSVRWFWFVFACFSSVGLLQAQCRFDRTKHTSAVPESFGWFGHSVAADADVAVVGFVFGDTGVFQGGEAQVYRRSGDTWNLEQILVPASLQQGDYFGYRAAIRGNVIAITAASDDQGGADCGAVYVFRHDGSSWIEEAKLVPSDIGPGRAFGDSLAVGDDVILAGAPRDDELGTDSGAAYFFSWDGASWSQDLKLASPDVDAFDLFGSGVDLDGADVAAIGSSQDQDVTVGRGAVFLFQRQAGVWTFWQKLEASTAGQFSQLGASVALDGNWLVAGDPLDIPGGTFFGGSASLYELDGGQWTFRQKLRAAQPRSFGYFGTAVDISGDRVLCGEPNGSGVPIGGAYAYRNQGGHFLLERRLASANPDEADDFGRTLAIAGDQIWVGASDSNESGLMGSGAAYVFERDPISLELLGTPSGGQSIQYRVSEATGLAWVLLSCTGVSGGLNLPNDPRDVPLTFDACTSFGLTVSPIFQGTVDAAGVALTPLHTFPSVNAGIRLYASAVTVNLGSGAFESVLCPITYQTQ